MEHQMEIKCKLLYGFADFLPLQQNHSQHAVLAIAGNLHRLFCVSMLTTSPGMGGGGGANREPNPGT